MGQMVDPAIDALAGFSSFPPTAPRGSTVGGDHAVPDGPRRATKSVTRSVRSVVSRFVLSPITTSGGRKILGICLHQAVIMTRPYRDVLVWLAGIPTPDNISFVERAIARVVALLATYDRDPRLAARSEKRFAKRSGQSTITGN